MSTLESFLTVETKVVILIESDTDTVYFMFNTVNLLALLYIYCIKCDINKQLAWNYELQNLCQHIHFAVAFLKE